MTKRQNVLGFKTRFWFLDWCWHLDLVLTSELCQWVLLTSWWTKMFPTVILLFLLYFNECSSNELTKISTRTSTIPGSGMDTGGWFSGGGSFSMRICQGNRCCETGRDFKELWIVNVFFWHQSLIIAGFTILLSIVVCDQWSVINHVAIYQHWETIKLVRSQQQSSLLWWRRSW